MDATIHHPRVVRFTIKIRTSLAPTLVEMYRSRAGVTRETATPELFLAEIIESAIAEFQLAAIDAMNAGVPSGPPLTLRRGPRGRTGNKPTLSSEDKDTICGLLDEGLKPKEIAGRFGDGGRFGKGLSVQTVRRIQWEREQ